MTGPDSITITRSGTEFLLRAEQLIPRRRAEVFPFFSDARNLGRITPAHLRFRILTPDPIEMREGCLINYRISLRGLSMRWRTRITRWDPPHRFEDTQIRGPYALWVHTHTFEDLGDETRMIDVVRYRVPLGTLGRVLNRALIRRDLRRIFEFRRDTIQAMFGPPDAATSPGRPEYAAEFAGSPGAGLAFERPVRNN